MYVSWYCESLLSSLLLQSVLLCRSSRLVLVFVSQDLLVQFYSCIKKLLINLKSEVLVMFVLVISFFLVEYPPSVPHSDHCSRLDLYRISVLPYCSDSDASFCPTLVPLWCTTQRSPMSYDLCLQDLMDEIIVVILLMSLHGECGHRLHWFVIGSCFCYV